MAKGVCLRKIIILLSVMLAVAFGASADTFNFAYSGAGVSANGVITAVPQGGSQFLATDITGFYNGDAITGIIPCAPPGSVCTNYGFAYNNLFDTNEPHFDIYGLLYSTAGGDIVNLYFDGTQYISWDASGGTVITEGRLTATPEPSTLLMLGSGMIGVAGVVRRKLF